MKRILRIFAWITFAAIAVAIIVRAAIVANKVEGGWQILREHLTAGLPPFVQRSEFCANPTLKWHWEQAELTEQDPRATANDLLCAAQLLRSSSGEFARIGPQSIGRAIWGCRKGLGERVGFPVGFEKTETIRELAARATDLEPMDPDVWRARIILLCELGTDARNSDDWVNFGSILGAATRTDPSNALYDYLLGRRCYLDSQTRVDRSTEDEYGSVLVVDSDLIQDCQDHYAAGFAKPKFIVRSNCLAAMADYLKRVPGPIGAKVSFIDAWEVYVFPVNVISRLREPFDDQDILNAENLGEIDGLNLWFVRENFDARWNAQCSATERPLVANLHKLLTANQRTQDEDRLLAASYAWQLSNAEELEQVARSSALPYAAVMASAIGWALCGTAIVAALAVWVLRRLGRLDGNGPRPALCYSIWLISLGATIAGLGFLCAQVRLVSMASPASVINPWFVIGTIIGVSVCAIAAMFWIGIRFVLRQGKRPREDRSKLFNWVRLGLAVIGNLLIVIPLLCVADPKIRRVLAGTWSELPQAIRLEWRVSVPADPSDRVSDALLQCGGHHGLLLTFGLWIVLLMVLRRRISLGATNSRGARLLTRFTGALRGVAKSGPLLAAIMFLISITTITQWTVHLQAMYERQLVRLANPRWVDAEIEANLKPLERPLTDSETEADPEAESAR